MTISTVARTRRIKRLASLTAIVALAAGAAFLLLHHSGEGAQEAPATETVKRGDLKATVAGVGTLQPETSVSLGFGAAGRVTSVDVRLGQMVQAGQILARLDDSLPQASLRAAQAQEAGAEAKLTQLLEGHTAQELRKASTANSAAARAVASTSRTAAKARAVRKAEIATLNSGLHQAQANHGAAVERLAANRAKLTTRQRETATSEQTVETAKAAVAQARAQIVALAGTREAARKKVEEEEKKERERAEAEEKKEREKAEEEGTEFKAKEAMSAQRGSEAGATYAEAAATSQLETAQSNLSEAQAAFERLRGEADTLRSGLPEQRSTVRSTSELVATAAKALKAGRATSAQTLRTSLEAAETARSTLETTIAAGAAEVQPSRSGEVAEAMAAVSQAEANVASGEKAVAETVLRAPTAGRVANLKVAVGDVVSGGSTSQSTSASSGSSGSTSSGESAEGSSGGSEASSSSTGATSGGSSSSPSIVLTSPRLKIFNVLLTQADAIKVKSGDEATLLIDALDRTVEGQLTSITPLPQVKNGVVNYTAAVATTNLPKELRIGMTAEVTLQTADRDNVVLLSRSAVSTTTGTVQLEVLDHGKRESRTVTLGVLGDQSVEVKSGLKPGDRVLLPSQPELGGAGGGEEIPGGEGEEFGGEGFGGEE